MVDTLTLDALGNKTPQKIGTEVTPVWTFECMQLQNTLNNPSNWRKLITWKYFTVNNNNHRFPAILHFTGQAELSDTSSQKLEDVVNANFYCPHALADGNQRIQIRQNTLVLSVIYTFSMPSVKNS